MFHLQHIKPGSVLRNTLFLLAFFTFTVSQAQDSDVTEILSQKDAAFWKAYNDCDIAAMEQFFSKDVEFYHDKGGIINNREVLSHDLENGLCRSGKNELRREAVPGTVRIYPLKNNGEIYGALMTGEHLFYLVQGESEKLDGRAKFSHLWLKKNGEWKMHRIFSFDHGPAVFQNPKKPIVLTPQELKEFTGKYLTASKEPITVELIGEHLELQATGKTFILLPENRHSFFTSDRDLTFTFHDHPRKLEILESDKVVEEAVFDQKQ